MLKVDILTGDERPEIKPNLADGNSYGTEIVGEF
jgi:hypothetical protein